MLSEYCKLAVSSVDQDWTSMLVCAVVTLNLCFPIILGLPFLKVNKIVIDHNDGTVVGKQNQYDLLNPIKLVAKESNKFVLMKQKFQKML